MWSDIVRTLRQAARGLLRSPGFTGVAVATLAVGVGAVTAAFSVVDAVVLRPLPYHDPSRVAMLWSAWKDFPQTWVSWDEGEVYREQVPALAEVALYAGPDAQTLGGEDQPERVQVGYVTANVFPTLGVSPALGRNFLPAEDRPGAEPVAVLGDALWHRRFAGDAAIVGRTIDLDGVRHLVVGVMPAGFRLPSDYASVEPADLWVAAAVEPTEYEAIPGPAVSTNGGSHTFLAVARLAPGATFAQANRQLAAVTDRLTREGVYPQEWGFRASVVPMPEEVGGELRPALRIVLGAALLVLLVACADVGGVLLARGERRRAEVGVRAALGGGSRGLAAVMLAEGLWLGIAAAVTGGLLAAGAVRLLRATAPAGLPRVDDAGIDLRVLAVAAGVALLAAAVAGMVSLAQALRVDPATLLRQGAHRVGGRTGAARGRQALVAAQAALTVVTLCAAGLMLRSVGKLLAVDPGFRSDGVVTAQLSLPSNRYPREAVAASYAEVVRRVAAIPGVESVGLVRVLPLGGEMGDRGMQVRGYQPKPGEAVSAEWQVVSPGYFATLAARRVAGRLLDARDQPAAPLVAVVNESFVKRYFAGREPVGGQFMLGSEAEPRTIVGVVADTRINSLTAEVKPRFYAPHGQGVFHQRSMHLVIRSDSDAAALAPELRWALAAYDPQLATSTVIAMDDVVAAATAQSRFVTGLLGLLAGLAVALGAVGTYGLVAQAASQRRREMGVRVAVGAHAGHVLGLVAREGVAAIAVGLLAGSALAWLVPRALGSLLWGVSAHDPTALLASWAVVLAAGIAAAAGPAWRASRADVVEALRES